MIDKKLISFLILNCVITVFVSCNFNEKKNDNSAQYQISVSAGNIEREGSIAEVSFPEHIEEGVYEIRDVDSENTKHIQIDDNSKGVFVVNELSKGEEAKYEFRLESKVDEDPKVSKEIDSKTISFYQNDSKILSYFYKEHDLPDTLDESYKRGGYIYPVNTPSGRKVTGRFSNGLTHQFGIFSAWTNTEFEGRNPDFWNIHEESGSVEVDSLVKSTEGVVFGMFSSKNYYMDLTAAHSSENALSESLSVYVYNIPNDNDYYIFDVEINQSSNYEKPLILKEYGYGGMALRGNEKWYESGRYEFLTSSGMGQEGDTEREVWVSLSGQIDANYAGIAKLGHPGNFRHPQPLRLHPDEPYLNYAPSQLGDFQISAGDSYNARYRYIVFDGEPDSKLIDNKWKDYAYPPSISVKEVN